MKNNRTNEQTKINQIEHFVNEGMDFISRLKQIEARGCECENCKLSRRDASMFATVNLATAKAIEADLQDEFHAHIAKFAAERLGMPQDLFALISDRADEFPEVIGN